MSDQKWISKCITGSGHVRSAPMVLSKLRPSLSSKSTSMTLFLSCRLWWWQIQLWWWWFLYSSSIMHILAVNMKVLEMMIMKAMVVTMRGLMTAVMVMVRRVLIKTLVGRSLLRSSCRPSYLSWGFCSNDDVAPCLLAESCFGSWFCFHLYQNGDVVSFLL